MEELISTLKNLKVGGKSKLFTVEVPTKTLAYSSGDNVGGLIQLKNIVTSNNGTAILKQIVIIDNDGQAAPLTFMFFDKDPSSLGIITDNIGFSWGSGSIEGCIAKINIATADYDGVINGKYILDKDIYSKVLQTTDESKDLYLVIITTGTPTYTTGKHSLTIKLGLLQD